MNSQLVKLLAEIAQSSGGDAIRARAQIDLIEVEIENVLLGIGALDPYCEDRFLRLAQIGLLACQKKVLRNLLRDGRSAFLLLLRHVVVDGAKDAPKVEAVMLVEVLIFGGEKSVDHQLRHGLHGNIDAPLLRKLGDEPAIACVNARDDRRLISSRACRNPANLWK